MFDVFEIPAPLLAPLPRVPVARGANVAGKTGTAEDTGRALC